MITLFESPRDAWRDVGKLLAACEAVFTTDDPDRVRRDVYESFKKSAAPLVELIRARALPPVVFEVAAGICLACVHKDYAAHPWLDPARALVESPDPAVRVAGIRVLPLALTGTTRIEMARARPELWANRARPVFEALCRTADVLGAGSFVSLERLGELANDARATGALSIVWLDEVACHAAGDPRAKARATELKALIHELVFCDNAVVLAHITRLGRAQSREEEKALQAAWLRIAGLPRDPPPPKAVDDVDDEDDENDGDAADDHGSVEERAVPDERKAPSAFAARYLRAIAELEEETERDIRAVEEHEGPFAQRRLPDDLAEALSTPIHFACTGFRCLYGLELLRDGLPKLQALVPRPN